MSEKKYPVDSLCFGLVDEKKKIAFLDNFGVYHNTNLSNAKADVIFNDKFKYISSLKETLVKHNLNMLIVDSNGNPKQYLNIGEIKYILNILERRLSMSQIMIQRSIVISSNIVNIVSDLLGLNISEPSTPFKFREQFDINEILISAKKLKLFKKYLFEYIQTSLIADKRIRLVYEVGARDYRITRSLNKAKIVSGGRLNQNIFSLDADLEGKIKVNDVDIKEYPKEFQKTIKF